MGCAVNDCREGIVMEMNDEFPPEKMELVGKSARRVKCRTREKRMRTKEEERCSLNDPTSPDRLHFIRPSLAACLGIRVRRKEGEELRSPVNVFLLAQTKLPAGIVACAGKIHKGSAGWSVCKGICWMSCGVNEEVLGKVPHV